MTSVEIAAKMEADAITFYREAAEKARNPVGKKMFLSIAEDEKGHLTMLKNALQVCELKITEAQPIKAVRTIFEEMKESMMQRVEATKDELEAFRIAMDMEKQGMEFYRKALAEAPSEKEKCLFERLIKEEEQHFKIFSETYAFMTDTGNWYMWDEHSIVEG
jgi:rubrerythrin